MDDARALAELARAGAPVVTRWPRLVDHVRLGGKRRLSFNAAPSTTQEVELSRNVSAQDWRSGVLLVRLHGKTSWASGTTMSAIVRRTSHADDDPSLLFSSSNMAVVDIASTAAAPRLFVSAFAAPISAAFTVFVRLTQPASSGAAAADLAIEIVGRTTRVAACCLPDVCRPAKGIVGPGRGAIMFRESWGSTTVPWQGDRRASSEDFEALPRQLDEPSFGAKPCAADGGTLGCERRAS